jgi:hypothetical protein
MIISYSGLLDASMGNHTGKIVSWFITMRTVLWIMWPEYAIIAVYFVYLSMRGMYPAVVIYPVSGSLVGSSSHVKESVRVRRRLI